MISVQLRSLGPKLSREAIALSTNALSTISTRSFGNNKPVVWDADNHDGTANQDISASSSQHCIKLAHTVHRASLLAKSEMKVEPAMIYSFLSLKKSIDRTYFSMILERKTCCLFTLVTGNRCQRACTHLNSIKRTKCHPYQLTYD